MNERMEKTYVLSLQFELIVPYDYPGISLHHQPGDYLSLSCLLDASLCLPLFLFTLLYTHSSDFLRKRTWR